MLESGQEVYYTAKGVSDYELLHCNRYLKPGVPYTIDYIWSDNWGDYVYLIEVSNKSFRPEVFSLEKTKEVKKSVSKIARDLPKEPSQAKR